MSWKENVQPNAFKSLHALLVSIMNPSLRNKLSKEFPRDLKKSLHSAQNIPKDVCTHFAINPSKPCTI